MKKRRILIPLGFLLVAALLSVAVMLLWNWLMPVIFGIGAINFWQSLGLLVLARILFGGFRPGKGGIMNHGMHPVPENPIHRKWMKMTPEQRKEFIDKRRRFGFGRPFDKDFDTSEQNSGKENE